MKKLGSVMAIALIALAPVLVESGPGRASAQQLEQTVIGPGMYIYQTRTRTASCNDDERTGYISSFVAPIHGVPGSRTMRMNLVNSTYWSTWSITVDPAGLITGDATLDGARGPNPPRAHFEVRRDRDRFTGVGYRDYTSTIDGQQRACRVEFDALLRRIDI